MASRACVVLPGGVARPVAAGVPRVGCRARARGAGRVPAHADAPALRDLSDFRVDAGRWKQENRDAAKGSPSTLLMTAASRALSALALADEAGLKRLRAEYAPAPTHTC